MSSQADLESVDYDRYTIALICALPEEKAACEQMLDQDLRPPGREKTDKYTYRCGKIQNHFVVIACLPEGRASTDTAGTLAAYMRAVFKELQFALMVGIGGGLPTEKVDIRLGDIVVSQPSGNHGGVVFYERGKQGKDGFEMRGHLNKPPDILLTTLSNLKSNRLRKGEKLTGFLQAFDQSMRERGFERPDVRFPYDPMAEDRLYRDGRVVARTQRSHNKPKVHYGLIGSANIVLANEAYQDTLLQNQGSNILCVETEAAGLMNEIGCLVIRGICDYADEHKNDMWHRYAAACAAAYAKEFLYSLDAIESRKGNPASLSPPCQNSTSGFFNGSPYPSPPGSDYHSQSTTSYPFHHHQCVPSYSSSLQPVTSSPPNPAPPSAIASPPPSISLSRHASPPSEYEPSLAPSTTRQDSASSTVNGSSVGRSSVPLSYRKPVPSPEYSRTRSDPSDLHFAPRRQIYTTCRSCHRPLPDDNAPDPQSTSNSAIANATATASTSASLNSRTTSTSTNTNTNTNTTTNSTNRVALWCSTHREFYCLPCGLAAKRDNPNLAIPHLLFGVRAFHDHARPAPTTCSGKCLIRRNGAGRFFGIGCAVCEGVFLCHGCLGRGVVEGLGRGCVGGDKGRGKGKKCEWDFWLGAKKKIEERVLEGKRA